MTHFYVKNKNGRYLSNTSRFIGISRDEKPTVSFTTNKNQAYIFPRRSYIQSYLESIARNVGIDNLANLLQLVQDNGVETVEKDIDINDYKFKKDGFTE